MSLYHSKTVTIPDQSGVITIGPWPNTSTMNATDNVLPSNWQQAHLFSQTLGGNTLGTGLVAGSNLILAGGNNITLSASQGTDGQATVSIVGGAAAGASINFSAGTTSGNLSAVTFANGSNVSFGLAAGVLTASVAASLAAFNISAGTTSGNLSSLLFSNGSGVSFGLNGGTITASVAAAAAGNTQSYWYNEPLVTEVLQFYTQSTSIVFPISPPTISASFARFIVGPNNASTSLATTATTSIAYVHATTFNVGIYTQNTGASSLSLSVLSTFTGLSRFSSTLTANVNGSEYSVGCSLSYLAIGTTSSSTFSYASTRAGFDFFTTQFSNFSKTMFLDIPMAMSLPGSNYWVMFGATTTAAATGAIGGTVANIGSVSLYHNAQAPVAPFVAGATAASPMLLGLGSFTMAGGGTTAALGFSNISSGASNVLPVMQLARQA